MIEKPTIAMVPIGDISPNVLTELGATVATNLDAKVFVAPIIALPSSAFDVRRGQYHSTEILRTLAAVKHEEWERVLGIVDVDLYVPDLHFVVGGADTGRGVAVFSLARLRPGDSTEKAKALFLKRAASEAIHDSATRMVSVIVAIHIARCGSRTGLRKAIERAWRVARCMLLS